MFKDVSKKSNNHNLFYTYSETLDFKYLDLRTFIIESFPSYTDKKLPNGRI